MGGNQKLEHKYMVFVAMGTAVEREYHEPDVQIISDYWENDDFL